MAALAHRRTGLDVAVALFSFAGAFAYLAAHPRNLGFTDEGLYLYEARRLLDGELFYRDIYEIIPPGSHYLMALMFGLFGTDIAVAKLTTAAVHAITAAVSYLAGRAAGVRPLLAACPSIAYVALAAPLWPYASPHWVGTCLSVLLLLAVIDGGREPSPRRIAAAGVLAGLATIVQHQRGLVFAAALALLLLARHGIERRVGGAAPARGLAARLKYLASGFLPVVVPVLVFLLASSGPAAMWVALVEHPFVHYGTVNRVAWGSVPILTAFLAKFGLPRLLKYMPAILALDAGRIARDLVRRGRPEELHVLSALLVLGLACAVSVAYRPDFIHLAFIAPLFFVAAAECVEWLARPLDRWRVGRWAVAAAALVLIGALTAQLRQNLSRARALYPNSAETAFGRIDFVGRKEIELIRRAEELVRETGAREIFSYPAFPALYLLTRTHNPTPYQLLLDEYSPPGQIEQAARILEERRVPLVVVFKPLLKKDDPVLGYLRESYERMDEKELFWKRRGGDE